jgi:transaldolase/glucose-6-phosphate isomerase
MTNSVQQVQGLSQSVWYDNISRRLITSGELQSLIDQGVSGLTSNPTIFEKAITGSEDYDDSLLDLARAGKDSAEIYERLITADIRAAADLLRPVHDRTGGADGYASVEVDPHLAHDTEGTVLEARHLHKALDRPNILIKVPGTLEGIPAIKRLIREGISVNATLIFSRDIYAQVREAYIAGLEDLAAAGGDLSRMASVASFFVSRVDTAVDGLLEEMIGRGQNELKALLGRAAVANAKLAYRDFRDTFGGDRFDRLRERGARVQRPLWASTSAKNPAYSDVLYVEPLIGRDTVNTMPDQTLKSFLDHGVAADTIEQDTESAEQALGSIEKAGVSMERVTATLLSDGVKAFADSFEQLMANIEEKCAGLVTTPGGSSRSAP